MGYLTITECEEDITKEVVAGRGEMCRYDIFDLYEKRIKELEAQADDRRAAMGLEICRLLRKHGHWTPNDHTSSDVIVAVGRALDGQSEADRPAANKED